MASESNFVTWMDYVSMWTETSTFPRGEPFIGSQISEVALHVHPAGIPLKIVFNLQDLQRIVLCIPYGWEEDDHALAHAVIFDASGKVLPSFPLGGTVTEVNRVSGRETGRLSSCGLAAMYECDVEGLRFAFADNSEVTLCAWKQCDPLGFCGDRMIPEYLHLDVEHPPMSVEDGLAMFAANPFGLDVDEQNRFMQTVREELEKAKAREITNGPTSVFLPPDFIVFGQEPTFFSDASGMQALRATPTVRMAERIRRSIPAVSRLVDELLKSVQNSDVQKIMERHSFYDEALSIVVSMDPILLYSRLLNLAIASAEDYSFLSDFLFLGDLALALEKLERARANEDPTELQLAIQNASTCGVDSSLIAAAVAEMRLLQALEADEDASELAIAISLAIHVEGTSPELLIRSEQNLVRKQAEARLSAAMQGHHVEELALAIRHAEALGTRDALLQSAKCKADLLEREQHGETFQHVELITSALSVGHTPSHNRIASLLSKVLSTQSNPEVLQALIQKLMQQGQLFDVARSRAYSLDGVSDYGRRGDFPYFKPKGWLRYALIVSDFEQYKTWPVGYHGTNSLNVASILLHGLQRPGSNGATVAHGQAHSITKKSIYLTPSIEYAAFPVYSQFIRFEEQGHWAQLVLQCRVRPGSFVRKPGTLGNKYWPQNIRFDVNFPSMDDLEWLVEDASDVIVYGLMMREFGPKADAAMHGNLVKSVNVGVGSQGPEFEWTKLRAQELSRAGAYIQLTR